MATGKYGDFRQFLEMQAAGSSEDGVDMLLENMPADKARLLSLCAIPHQFNERILMALDLSLDEEMAQQRCDEFARLSIVNESEFGLTLNDTARKRLFDKWLRPESAVEFRSANERLKNHLLNRFEEISADVMWTAQRAYIFHLIGADQDAGFVELAVRFNQASEQYALDECEILVTVAYEYEPILSPNNLAWLKYFDAKLAADQQRFKDAVRLLKSIVSSSNIDGELLVKAHERLGIVYQVNRDWTKAVSQFDEAMALARADPKFESQVTRIMQNVGAVYREKGDFDEAERILKKCIDMNEDPFNAIGLAASYNALGILYRQLRNSTEAIEAFTSALEALPHSENSYRIAQIYNNLGLTYADMLQWSLSEKSFNSSLDVKEKLDDKYGQGKTITNLARISAQRGDFDEAISLSEKAIQLFSKLRARYSLAKVHRNTGKIYKAAKKPELADKHLRIAADLFRDIKDKREADLTEAELHAVYHKDKLHWAVKGVFVLLALLILFVIAIFLL